jgi:hypothetical protein
MRELKSLELEFLIAARIRELYAMQEMFHTVSK